MADFSALTDDRAALAAELATRLLPVPEVMKRYNMTTAELTTLLADSQFKNMVRDFRREWESPMSARERVKLKSSLAVEDGIVELYRIFKDIDTVPAARIDAFKQLVGLADMQPKKEGAEAGPAFSLTLNLGGTDDDISKTITIDADAEATTAISRTTD